MKKQLVRPRDNRVIAGVCAGIGNYLNLDPTLIRIVAALIALWSCGAAVLIYLVLALIIPLEPVSQPALSDTNVPDAAE